MKTVIYNSIQLPEFAVGTLVLAFLLGAYPVLAGTVDNGQQDAAMAAQGKQPVDAATVEQQQSMQQGLENLQPGQATSKVAADTALETGTVAAMPDKDVTATEAQADTTMFDVWEYRVEGNNVLDRGYIERAVYPYLGPQRTIAMVEAARSSLEQVYKNNGFPTVLVDIPEQDVNDGIVTLKVTEGKIGQVSITGSRYYSLGKIREQVPSLQEGITPYMPQVQEELASLNKGVAGRVVTPVLRPGDTPGKLDVELKVKDKFPLHGSIDVNDRFINNTSRLRLNANLRYDNLWQKSHSASVGYVVAPENRDEVEVVFGTYIFRFPGSDNLLAFYAVNSASDIASTGDINQIGNGVILGSRAIFPLPTLDSYTHNLSLGVDYKDFDESTELLGFDVLNTPASYLSFVPSYTGNWFREDGRTSLSLEAHLGPRGLGNTAKEFANKRVGAKPNFVFFTGELTHEQRMLFGTTFNFRISGQLADAPLIANEQFTAGGVDSVRGYTEAQQLGDDGVIGSVQLNSPSIADSVASFLDDFHFFGFMDAARLSIQQPLPDQTARFSLASVGLGLEIKAFESFNSNVLWAYALSDNNNIRRGDSRVHFNLGYEF